MALRLGRQLKKTNAVIKELIKEYNSSECAKVPNPEKIDFDLLKSNISADMTNDTKRVLINLSETVDRCDEEVFMVKTEMKCVFCFYKKQHERLFSFLSQSESGVLKSVLLSEGLHLEKRLIHLDAMFSGLINIGQIPLSFHHMIGLSEPYFERQIDTILSSLASDEIFLQEIDEADLYDTEENIEQDETED